MQTVLCAAVGTARHRHGSEACTVYADCTVCSCRYSKASACTLYLRSATLFQNNITLLNLPALTRQWNLNFSLDHPNSCILYTWRKSKPSVPWWMSLNFASLFIAPDDHKPLRRRLLFWTVGLYHQACWKIWVLLACPFTSRFIHVVSYIFYAQIFLSSRCMFVSASLTC